MKNKFYLIAILIIIPVILGLAVLKQPSNPPETPPGDTTTDFNLIFKYGISGKNELNTFNQTYTKDMIMDTPITVEFKLSESELTDIYQKINDFGIFNDKELIEENVAVTPCSSYYLKVQINSEQKELFWDNCRGRVNDELQQFTDYIIQVIESKDEYKELPDAKGGYL